MYPWKDIFVRVLIPIFAIAVLLANLTGWFTHGQCARIAVGTVGLSKIPIGEFGLMDVFAVMDGFLTSSQLRGTFCAGSTVIAVIWGWVRRPSIAVSLQTKGPPGIVESYGLDRARQKTLFAAATHRPSPPATHLKEQSYIAYQH